MIFPRPSRSREPPAIHRASDRLNMPHMFALRFAKSAARGLARMPQGIARRMLGELKTIATDPAAHRGDWKPLQGPPARARCRGGGRTSSSYRRTSNATSSGCSGMQAGPMRVTAGKARTAPCRLSGWQKNWRVIRSTACPEAGCGNESRNRQFRRS